MKMVNDAIAFKKSARTYDQDGRLRVASMPITKANVCQYLGREIPDNDKLGLQPDKLYKLYRHPDALQQAIMQFNGIPIMDEHHYQTAQKPNKDKIIGSLGSNASFDDPYVTNSATFWDDVAIKRIEDGSQKELSATYNFKPEMRPGTTPEGEDYDGVMRDIRVNHLALVPEGRAGHDVSVSDSALINNNEGNDMADNTPTPPTLDDIVSSIQSCFCQDCTQDQVRASLSAVIAQLNNGAGGDDTVSDEKNDPPSTEKPASDDDLTPKDKKDNIKGEEKAQETLKKEGKAEDDGDKDGKDKDDKSVSDAINKAVEQALKYERLRRDAIDMARDDVRTIGINAPVSDSAEAVYLYGLQNSGYSEAQLKGVNLAGLKLLTSQVKHNKTQARAVSDSKQINDFKKVTPRKI